MLVGAIDPGKQGGYAVFDTNTGSLVTAGRFNFDSLDAMSIALAGCTEILIERAQASAQMGMSSSFEYGRAFGRAEGVAMLTGATIYYCSPAWWKGRLGVPTDKKRAVSLAVKRIPELKNFVRLASDDGIAEAALLGTVLLSQKLFNELVKNNDTRKKPKRKKTQFKL